MNDPWIAAHSPIEAERLHCIGYIVVQWNECEFMLRGLYCAFTGHSFTKAWELTHNKRPSEISDPIEQAIRTSIWPDTHKQAFWYALDLMDICRINRNQFSHFLLHGRGEDATILNIKSADYRQIFRQPPVPSELARMRALADEINATGQYLADIFNYMSRWRGARVPSEERFPSIASLYIPPLPEIAWTLPDQGTTPRQQFRRRSSLP